MSASSPTPNPPSVIQFKEWKFVIFDAPTDANLDAYLREFKRNNVTHFVRACDPSYSTEKIVADGIQVFEMPFTDGAFPPDSVIGSWLSVCMDAFGSGKYKDNAVGVHCIAGLGRAPVLVAIALVELGMKYDEAVDFIRQKRKGAINSKQLKTLKTYKPRRKGGCCIV